MLGQYVSQPKYDQDRVVGAYSSHYDYSPIWKAGRQ